MSGGSFDYYNLCGIIEQIEELISKHGHPNDCPDDYPNDYPNDIIEHFRVAISVLKLADQMIHRIDWLISGDDGEDTFRQEWPVNQKNCKEIIDEVFPARIDALVNAEVRKVLAELDEKEFLCIGEHEHDGYMELLARYEEKEAEYNNNLN